MERRDYLQRQIDQLGKALGKMITLLMDGKGSGDTSEKIEQVSKITSEHLDMEIEELLNIPEEDFLKTLKENKNLSNYHLENISQVLQLIGEELLEDGDKEKAKPYLMRTVILLEYLESQDSTFDMERSFNINEIKSLIS